MEIVLRSAFEPAVKDQAPLATVGNDLNLANDDVVERLGCSVHVGAEGELEFADAICVDGELRAADPA